MELTHGSLFSGIGGFDLGFERAGFRSVWQVEIDDYCRRVLEKHFPEARRYSDIRSVGKHNLEPVNVITGGFPCQPFSVAGKRRGKEDDRYLWPEMLRVIREVRPRFVVAENVPGIGKMALEQVLSDLESEGYENYRERDGKGRIAPMVIPACGVDAHHRRDRLWIVAHTRRELREARSEVAGVLRPLQENGAICDNAERSSEIMAHPANARIERVREREVSAVENVADARLLGQEKRQEQAAGLEQRGKDVADSERVYAQGQQDGQGEGEFGRGGWWLPESNVGRVAHGVPNRVDRLKCLGNAIVPQIAEEIAWRIREAIETTTPPITGGEDV